MNKVEELATQIKDTLQKAYSLGVYTGTDSDRTEDHEDFEAHKEELNKLFEQVTGQPL